MKEDSETRSRTMRAVKGKNTAPELIVRRLIFALGYRYRLYRRDLPGKPDLTFPRLRKTIFVNGCFWHGHLCRRGARVPLHNREYWIGKIARNVERDKLARKSLRALGWTTEVIWECELKNLERIQARVERFLRSSHR